MPTIDPIKLPQEIKNKYSVVNNAFRLDKIKNAELDKYKKEPKDEINTIVGDDKQPDIFYPQLKICRWSNEVNLSVRLKDTEYDKALITTNKDKITWDKGNTKIEFYDYEEGEGGHKMVWYLKSKPASNKVEFTIQSKGLDFFYQPELTQEEIDDGVNRPENVVGSYAVYHQTKGGMVDSYGKAYATGKAFHIYRPKIIDSDGKETWGILNIENGIYSIEIPQEFLNKAVYPIRSNDTFGNEGEGGSAFYIGGSSSCRIIGYKAAPNSDGSATQISGYFNCSTVAARKVKLALYVYTANQNIGAYIETTEERSLEIDANPNLLHFTLDSSQEVIDGTNYYLCAWGEQIDYSRIYYDATGGIGPYVTLAYTTWPNPITGENSRTYKYSIYATYTPAGGEEYVMGVTVGAFVLTGIAALLVKALNIICSVGSLTLTGINAILTRGYTLAAGVGEIILTGIDTILTSARSIVAGVGAFTLSGIAALFTKALNIAVSAGEFTLSGINVGLNKGWAMAVGTGVFVLTGIIATFTKALNMACSAGSFTLTGIAAILTKIEGAVTHFMGLRKYW